MRNESSYTALKVELLNRIELQNTDRGTLNLCYSARSPKQPEARWRKGCKFSKFSRDETDMQNRKRSAASHR